MVVLTENILLHKKYRKFWWPDCLATSHNKFLQIQKKVIIVFEETQEFFLNCIRIIRRYFFVIYMFIDEIEIFRIVEFLPYRYSINTETHTKAANYSQPSPLSPSLIFYCFSIKLLPL